MAVEARLMASSPRPALSAGAILKVRVRASGAALYQPVQHGAVSRPEACCSVQRAKLDEQWTVQTPGASDSPARNSFASNSFGRRLDAGLETAHIMCCEQRQHEQECVGFSVHAFHAVKRLRLENMHMCSCLVASVCVDCEYVFGISGHGMLSTTYLTRFGP